jgi:hypothetical protein
VISDAPPLPSTFMEDGVHDFLEPIVLTKFVFGETYETCVVKKETERRKMDGFSYMTKGVNEGNDEACALFT